MAVLVVSCGGSSDSSPEGADSQSSTETTPEAPPDSAAETPSGTGSDVSEASNACDVLTVAEVSQYLGEVSDGAFSDSVNSCYWENPSTFESVTLTIGAAGTAASGALSAESDYGATEPVAEIGDTARYSPEFGIVEFVAGDRASEVQVAVLDETIARDGAVGLAQLAISRL